jgi:hypothetical protein
MSTLGILEEKRDDSDPYNEIIQLKKAIIYPFKVRVWFKNSYDGPEEKQKI